jgi:hypothetical protein
VTAAVSGSPRRSQTRWSLLPGLPLAQTLMLLRRPPDEQGRQQGRRNRRQLLWHEVVSKSHHDKIPQTA